MEINSESKIFMSNDSIIITDGAPLILCKSLFLLRVRGLKILGFIRLKKGILLIFDLILIIFMLNNIQFKNRI